MRSSSIRTPLTDRTSTPSSRGQSVPQSIEPSITRLTLKPISPIDRCNRSGRHSGKEKAYNFDPVEFDPFQFSCRPNFSPKTSVVSESSVIKYDIDFSVYEQLNTSDTQSHGSSEHTGPLQRLAPFKATVVTTSRELPNSK
jgi:hypothetical protein